MLVRALWVEGLSGLPRFEARGLGRVVRVGGLPRARTALADALALALGSFSAKDTATALHRLGFGHELRVDSDPLPEAVTLGRPDRVKAMLDATGEPRVRVRLELELDPPQFGAVRRHAARHPELAGALGEDAALLRLAVGWAFTRDLSLATLSVMGLRLGDVAPTPGEANPWQDELLAGLGGRVAVRAPGGVDADAFARAERSTDPELRARVTRLREALRQPPFELGELHVVDPGDGRVELVMGESLQPLRALGPGVEDLVGLAQALFLSEAEILVVERPGALWERPEEVVDWLVAQLDTNPSPLEQLWLVGLPEPHDLVAEPIPEPSLGRVLSR